ADYLQLAR
uniref:Extended FMRFamide-2 n=1 Tax=Striatophasma naukluftense TaxID=1041429 RepID=FAR2_STRNA|nr:RecName: Full=Extended FMRFamide-2; Short=FMRFa-2 [Striatophasma naukluftense]